MCLAVPGRVVAILDSEKQILEVELGGINRKVYFGLLSDDEQPSVGDWVVVHVGMALSKIDEVEALDMLRVLEEITNPPEMGEGDEFSQEVGVAKEAFRL